MSENVTLVFDVSWGFQEPQLLKHMEIAIQRKTSNTYEKKAWSIDGLTIKLFEKKLVVQGGLNHNTKGISSRSKRRPGTGTRRQERGDMD